VKVALITTTISVPHVLSLYRRLGPDVRFFVAVDRNTPGAAVEYMLTIADCVPVLGEQWKCSDLIDWNCIQRRNVALLEALRWGADIIVSVDTDDFPVRPTHFAEIEHGLSRPFSGVELRSTSGWVDPGWLLDSPISHRGMPVRLDPFQVHPAVDRWVGVMASTVAGSCDVSAFDRMAGAVRRHGTALLAETGAVIDPAYSRTLFNSEAVAFTREVAPAMMVLVGVGRVDDLAASLIAQRVMRERGLCVHVGPPVVWHERAHRDLRKDLREEMWGYENIERLAAYLDKVSFEDGTSVVNMARGVWNCLSTLNWMPKQAVDAALAFLDDCEPLL